MTSPRLLKYFLIAAFGLTAFIYTLGVNGVFTYDDIEQIVNRPALHRLFNLHDVIFCGLRQNRVWQNLSLSLNWTIAPGQTWSFKLFNLILHLLNGALLYQWLKRIFQDKPYLPVLATAFFLIHPLQIQSITYVMGVIMLLYGFFTLLVFNWYEKYSLSRFPGLVLILITSLFARETCVFLPLALLIYDHLFRKTPLENLPKIKWAILFAVPLLYYPLSIILHDPGQSMYATTGHGLYPFGQYLTWQLYFQSFYVALFLNPTLQSIIHVAPNPGFNQTLGAVLGIGIWIGGILFTLKKNRTQPRATFFVFFFFLNYLPTNSFLQVINPFAEYRLYLANLSLCILLAYSVHEASVWLKKKTPLTQTTLTLPAIIFAVFAMFTLKNVLIWKNSDFIFTQAVNRYPNHDFNSDGLGNEYLAVAWRYYQDGNYQAASAVVDTIGGGLGRYKMPATFSVLKSLLEKKATLQGKQEH